jgi:hypothetical protein
MKVEKLERVFDTNASPEVRIGRYVSGVES